MSKYKTELTAPHKQESKRTLCVWELARHKETGSFRSMPDYRIRSAAVFFTLPLDVWVGLWLCCFMCLWMWVQIGSTSAATHCSGPSLHPIVLLAASCSSRFAPSPNKQLCMSCWRGAGGWLSHCRSRLSLIYYLCCIASFRQRPWLSHRQKERSRPLKWKVNCALLAHALPKIKMSKLIDSGLKVWIKPCQDTN